jgi:hypothetical protein
MRNNEGGQLMILKRLSPRLRLILIGMLAASVVVIVVSRSSQTFDREAQRKASIERVHAYLHAGVGSEVRFASAGARPDDVRASLDSMAEFIRYRSGLELDEEVKGRLARMEERVLNGNGQRIPVDELGNLFTTILVERLHNCTDGEIEQAADAAVNVKTMPLKYDKATGKTVRIDKAKEGEAAADNSGEGNGFSRGKCKSSGDVMLRFSGEGKMSREAFILQAKSLRSRFQSPLQQVAIVGIARQMVTRIVRNRVEALSAALPEQWAEAQNEALTPVQAFLIAYSTASDDPLWYSRNELKNLSKHLERMWKEDTGEAISYEGQTAFGTSGYLFSSPLGLAFNQQTTDRLLKLIDERSAK